LERFPEYILDGSHQLELSELLRDIGRAKRNDNPMDPHRVLAELRCPIYITTNPDQLLAQSLEERGLEVEERSFDWLDNSSPLDSEYWPSSKNPLVYHLFGSFVPHRRSRRIDMKSVVLTQDEYFQYLVAMTRDKKSIPEPVGQALTHSALLFIGFQLSDWDFRILLQSIRERGGASGLERYNHVAVHIDPVEGQFLDPEVARRYLERMARIEIKNFSVFWGTVESFLKELQQRLAKRRKDKQKILGR
jgi:hypothetical protein